MNVWTRLRARLRIPVTRHIVTAVAVSGLMLGGWWLHGPVVQTIRNHPYFRVTEIEIRGAGPLLTPRDVRAWIGNLETFSVWDASPAHLRKRLESHPLIDHASVQRQFPNHVEIDIRERRPEAIALLDQLYYVDRSGRLLTPLTAEHARDYPVITGLVDDGAPGYRTWAFRRAMRLLRLCDRMACAAGVSEVHLDKERGVELYPVSPKVSVILGWGSWREKLTRANHVLESWSGYTDRLLSLDARFHNQVVVKLRAPAPEAPRARNSGKVRI